MLFRRSDTTRASRPRLINPLLATLAVACVVVIEALHGHACTGDGCLLCLMAGAAHVVLGLCLSAVLARPLLSVLARMRVSAPVELPAPAIRMLLPVDAGAQRAAQTPVSWGVRLLI